MKSNELRILATNYAKLSKELMQAANTLLTIEKMQGMESKAKKQKTTTKPSKIKLSKKQISSNKNSANDLIGSINKMSENIGAASEKISKL